MNNTPSRWSAFVKSKPASCCNADRSNCREYSRNVTALYSLLFTAFQMVRRIKSKPANCRTADRSNYGISDNRSIDLDSASAVGL